MQHNDISSSFQTQAELQRSSSGHNNVSIINNSQLNYTNTSDGPIAVYIHWPFCRSKCPYCDFNSHVVATINHQEWLDAYRCQLDLWAPWLAHRPVSSIFFGGGTPSLMEPWVVSGILQHLENLQSGSRFVGQPEITLEANPTSVESSRLAGFADAGINRISLGVQSLRDDDLRFLGREHHAGEAIKAIQLARHHFTRMSFDLIYARPHQTIEAWGEELAEAMDYAVDHLSLYQLTIEKGTPFYQAYRRQEFILPDDNLAADLYEYTQEEMARYGMHAYEISNHARLGQESRHNLTYWQYDDYIGIGPGAHGRISSQLGVWASMCYHAPALWLEASRNPNLSHPALQQWTLLSSNETFEEQIMMGIRLKKGISWQRLDKRHGQLHSKEQLCAKWQWLVDEGLLTWDEHYVRATNRGLLVLNQLIHSMLSALA
jgi:putative oxygen-independent coproporphyrinogen III oxidase